MARSSSAMRMVAPVTSSLPFALGAADNHRQPHAEDGAARLAVELDDAAMVADDLGDQRQAEAGAVGLGGHEGVEQMVAQILGYPFAIVLDAHHQRQIEPPGGSTHSKPHAMLESGGDD